MHLAGTTALKHASCDRHAPSARQRPSLPRPQSPLPSSCSLLFPLILPLSAATSMTQPHCHTRTPASSKKHTRGEQEETEQRLSVPLEGGTIFLSYWL